MILAELAFAFSRITVALVLIIGVLLFKPTGMFGKVFVSRV